MHCNGKCYLTKKLKEQQNPDQQTPVTRNEKFDMVPFFVPKPFILKEPLAVSQSHYFIKNENGTFSFHSSIFHPPSA